MEKLKMIERYIETLRDDEVIPYLLSIKKENQLSDDDFMKFLHSLYGIGSYVLPPYEPDPDDFEYDWDD